MVRTLTVDGQNELVEDFIQVAGYSRSEAIIAARQVDDEDQKDLF